MLVSVSSTLICSLFSRHLTIFVMTVLSRAVHGGWASPDPSVVQATSVSVGKALLVEAVLCFAYLLAPLQKVNFAAWIPGTTLTGSPSIFISVSRSRATLASRALKGEKVCGSTKSQSESENRRRTQRRSQGSPNSLHLRIVTKPPGTLYYTHQDETQDPDRFFDCVSEPVPFFPPPLCSHLLRSSSSASLFFFSLSSSLPSTSFRRQLLRKYSSRMAWYSRSKSPPFWCSYFAFECLVFLHLNATLENSMLCFQSNLSLQVSLYW